MKWDISFATRGIVEEQRLRRNYVMVITAGKGETREEYRRRMAAESDSAAIVYSFPPASS